MSTLGRIASLHRELAQAYEDLDREARERRQRKPSAPVEPQEPARPEVRERVRTGLRRAGIRA